MQAPPRYDLDPRLRFDPASGAYVLTNTPDFVPIAYVAPPDSPVSYHGNIRILPGMENFLGVPLQHRVHLPEPFRAINFVTDCMDAIEERYLEDSDRSSHEFAVMLLDAPEDLLEFTMQNVFEIVTDQLAQNNVDEVIFPYEEGRTTPEEACVFHYLSQWYDSTFGMCEESARFILRLVYISMQIENSHEFAAIVEALDELRIDEAVIRYNTEVYQELDDSSEAVQQEQLWEVGNKIGKIYRRVAVLARATGISRGVLVLY